jgi:hypothetical protein
MRTLTDLDLADTQITDDGLAHIANLVRLRSLGLTNTAISERLFEWLKKLPSLRDVHIGGTMIDPRRWESLAGPNLLLYH